MSDLTPEQMQALIEADRQRRVEATRAAIETALQAQRCRLVAMPQLAPDGRIVAVVMIEAV